MITIKEYIDYKHEEIMELYKSVNWTNYTDRPDMLKKSYINSLKTLAAYDDNKLVGIIRIVGDGISIIYIQDLIVLPTYQRKGIGTKLLKEILDLYKDTYQKVLLTDNTEKNVTFYKSLGFVPCKDNACQAFMKNY